MYTFSTWLFFFYFYCFLGWIWETCYVSVLKAKWVNRGFMRGPFLPIYGSGAIVVLVFTLPFRTNAVFVFFAGMISATILEYFTGVAMEKLFHVRYWDYSNYFINLNGRVCLEGSIIFGLAGCIVMYIGEPFFLKIFNKIPYLAKLIICFSLLTLFIIDNIYSQFYPNTGEGITYTEKKENT